MSRIDDLIVEHCPRGVELKKLSEVGEFVRGGGLQKKDFVEQGFPCIHYGQIYTFYGTSASTTKSFVAPDLAARLKHAETGDLVITTTSENIADVCTAVAWLGEGTIAIGGHSCVYKHTLDPMYVAYYFQTEQFEIQKRKFVTGTKVKDIKVTDIGRIEIPVPPLAIQREIVSILDKMESLKAELEAELDLRSRQHKFYWNALLTPGDGWRRTALGQIAAIFDGPHATPKKTESGPWYLSISSLKSGRFDLASSAHLSADQFGTWTRRVSPNVGDTLFSYETRLGQAAFWAVDEPAALGRRMGLLRPKAPDVYPPFLTLAYLGPEFQALIRAKTVSGATVDRIPIADMSSWEISVPPLAEQHRIVKILDKFDTLANDLSIGLPAEIAARRQQYEYYRDRLLTFDKAVA